MVHLKIGGDGQIVDVCQPVANRYGMTILPYRVRFMTAEGPKYKWFREFELEVQ